MDWGIWISLSRKARHQDRLLRQAMLDRIIIEHFRKPARYHMHFLAFLLLVIVFCLVVLVTRGQ